MAVKHWLMPSCCYFCYCTTGQKGKKYLKNKHKKIWTLCRRMLCLDPPFTVNRLLCLTQTRNAVYQVYYKPNCAFLWNKQLEFVVFAIIMRVLKKYKKQQRVFHNSVQADECSYVSPARCSEWVRCMQHLESL